MTLKELRKSKGYRQEYMATMLGMSRTTYSYKETGREDFTLSEAFKVSKLLNVRISDIEWNLKR